MTTALLLTTALALAPPGLSAYQHESLVAACNAGQQHGLCLETMTIVLLESSACVDLVGDDGVSLGCGQLQLRTARELDPTITREELVRHRGKNLRLTAENLARCLARFGTKSRAIVCFNRPADARRMTDAQIKSHPYLLVYRKRESFIRARYGAE